MNLLDYVFGSTSVWVGSGTPYSRGRGGFLVAGRLTRPQRNQADSHDEGRWMMEASAGCGRFMGGQEGFS